MKSFRTIILLLCAVLMLYLPFLGNAFISDDVTGLVKNAALWKWYDSIGWPNLIHLGGLVEYIIYHTVGLVPWAYRATTIASHAGCAILVYLLVRRHASERVACVSSLLFAVHPLATESVIWISGGIVYGYSALFFLLSLYWYRRRSLLSLLAFLLSLLFSEKSLPLVCIFPLSDWVFGSMKKNWKSLIPYCVITVVCIVFYILRIPMRTEEMKGNIDPSLPHYRNMFITLPLSFGTYTKLYIWPYHLTFHHVAVFRSFVEHVLYGTVTIAIGMLATLGIMKKKFYGFWIIWIPITLGVTLLPIPISWVVAERYVYLGLVGYSVCAAMIYERIVAGKSQGIRIVAFIVGVVILVVLGTRTMVRNSEWRNEKILWTVTLRESPGDANSWNNIGEIYASDGEYEMSIRAFQQALVINPKFSSAYHNIGYTYLLMEKYDEAVLYFEKSISLNPRLWQAYAHLGTIAQRRGDLVRELEYKEKALEFAPTREDLYADVQELLRQLHIK